MNSHYWIYTLQVLHLYLQFWKKKVSSSVLWFINIALNISFRILGKIISICKWFCFIPSIKKYLYNFLYRKDILKPLKIYQMKWEKTIFWVWRKLLVSTIFTLSVPRSITLTLWQLYATVPWHPEVTYHGTINLFIKSWYFSSSVDFVLKDQREKEKDVEEKRPPHREEMDVVPKPWHKDYVAGLEAMSQKLHITTPCMLQVLDFWHTKFG